MLAQEGFVSKASGRSARVVSLSEDDVLRLYELRGALEGLAGRLATERGADTTGLQETVNMIWRSIWSFADSGNEYLVEHARRILMPLFAFVRIRVIASGQGTSPWDRELDAHQRIHDLVCEGEGRVAEQYIQQVMARFSAIMRGTVSKTTPGGTGTTIFTARLG